jgi:hypothetical protein
MEDADHCCSMRKFRRADSTSTNEQHNKAHRRMASTGDPSTWVQAAFDWLERSATIRFLHEGLLSERTSFLVSASLCSL